MKLHTFLHFDISMEKQYIHQYLHHIEYLYMSVDTYNDIDHHLNYNKLHSNDMEMNYKDLVHYMNHPNLKQKDQYESFIIANEKIILLPTSFKI